MSAAPNIPGRVPPSGQVKYSRPPVPGATSYDVLFGYLDLLWRSGGNFSSSYPICLCDNWPETSDFTDEPPDPGAYYYLVRPNFGSVHGSFDESGTHQFQSRDPQLSIGPDVCP